VTEFGNYLVTGSNGESIYIFSADYNHTYTECDSSCEDVWPLVTVNASTVANYSASLTDSLVGAVNLTGNPGYAYVTYNGWPLYTYFNDLTGNVSG